MLNKVILIYNVDSPAYRTAVEKFCREHEIRLKYVEPDEYDVPLGFVAYGTEEDKAEYIREGKGKEFSEPMMVFSGFAGDSLFECLKDLRIAGITTTDLKAVMTEHNAVWDSAALADELRKEHRYMQEMKEKNRKKE